MPELEEIPDDEELDESFEKPRSSAVPRQRPRKAYRLTTSAERKGRFKIDDSVRAYVTAQGLYRPPKVTRVSPEMLKRNGGVLPLKSLSKPKPYPRTPGGPS